MLADEFHVRDFPSAENENARPEKDADPFFSEENIARLEKSMAQLERGEVVTKTMDELRTLVYGQATVF